MGVQCAAVVFLFIAHQIAWACSEIGMPLIIIATRELTKIINEHYTPMQPISSTYMILLTIETSLSPLIFLPPFVVVEHIWDSTTLLVTPNMQIA